MTQSPDHPELVYLEALQTDGKPMYTIGRPDGPPLWHVIHDMEKTEDQGCAEWTANYFHTGAGGRSVSSHYTADSDSVVQCVLLRHSAWTVGNRPGNNRGINWELCGYASQTRAQWLDPFGVAMFERVVPVMRADGLKYGIPPERRTVEELRAWKKGVTSHNDLRLAFNVTSHTDPGSNFPWDYFMALLNGAAPAPQPVGDEMIIFAIDKSAGQVYRCNGVTCVPVPDGEVLNQTYVYGGGEEKWKPVSSKANAVGPWFATAVQVDGAAAGVKSHLAVYDMGFFGQPLEQVDGGGGGLTYEQTVAAAKEGAELAEDT